MASGPRGGRVAAGAAPGAGSARDASGRGGGAAGTLGRRGPALAGLLDAAPGSRAASPHPLDTAEGQGQHRRRPLPGRVRVRVQLRGAWHCRPVVQPPRASGVPQVHQDAAAVSAAKKPLAPPSPPLLVVNGGKVPMKQEDQYKEYYRLTLGCPDSCTMCHMCFFDRKRADNGIVRNSGMLLHCSVKHKKPGTKCPVDGCYVRVGTKRELELHVHFCHILP